MLRAERYAEESPAAAYALVADATKVGSGVFDESWPNFRLHLELPQGLLTMLEDQARWAIANRHTEAAEVPNFLESVYVEAMLAVRPAAVSIIR